MARVSVEGFGELDAMFKKLGDVPWDITESALNAMAENAETAVRNTGLAMGVRDPESSVHILDKVTHTKPKRTAGGGFCEVTFSGRRKRGNTATRNAEIAFINEYGKDGQAPRPFIRTAAERDRVYIAADGEKIVGDWMEKTFNNG